MQSQRAHFGIKEMRDNGLESFKAAVELHLNPCMPHIPALLVSKRPFLRPHPPSTCRGFAFFSATSDPKYSHHPSPTPASPRRLPALQPSLQQPAVQPCCRGLQQRPRRGRWGGGWRRGPLLPRLPPSVLPPAASSQSPRIPLKPHPLRGRGAEVAGRGQEVLARCRRHGGDLRGRKDSPEVLEPTTNTHTQILTHTRHVKLSREPNPPTRWNYVNSSVDSCTISLFKREVRKVPDLC